MSSKKKPSPKKDIVKKSKPAAKASKAKPAAKPAKKPAAKAQKAVAAKPIAKKAKPASKAKPAAKASVAKAAKKPEAKPVAKKAAEKTKPAVAAQAKPQKKEIESSLMISGTKFLKVPFFFDAEKEEKEGKHKRATMQKAPEKPTASSRPKIGSVQDTKNLVELLSQQLEFENKMFLEGCEGQICVKCNFNIVDAKYYVDKSLGYCSDCAVLLGLGQSKEGVFSDAQMELMRRSMEKSIDGTQDIDEDDIESALGDMDSLELEEALLAVEEVEFNA